MRKIMKKAQRGFTLIELMIVVAIIGILAAVAIPMFMDSMKKAKKSEAMIQLKKIAGAAKESYAINASFPADAAATPANDCCTQNYQSKKKCDVVAADWAVASWQALDFQMDEPFFFQYAFDEGAPAGGFTATATGDLDCDATPIIYTATGTTAAGNLKIEYVEPPPNTD